MITLKQIEELTDRAADAEADPGDRIVLSRQGYGSGDRIPFSGDHGHPFLPTEAAEMLWLKGPYWESIGSPETITVTIEAGGDPVPAPLTTNEKELLRLYDEQEAAREQAEREQAERDEVKED